MAVYTITYYGVHFAAFIALCCVTSIVHVSGYSDAADHSLYCNGRWCVQNEEYCDKIQNKCILCQYTQHNCTPHLDCLSYCIGKGIDEGMQDMQDSIPEENSASTWAIPMSIVLLVLFIISFGFNISLAVRFHRQQKAASQTGMGLDIVTIEEHETEPLADAMRDNDSTEGQKECKGVQEQGSESNEVMRDKHDKEAKKIDKDEEIPFLEVMRDNDDAKVEKLYEDEEITFNDMMGENHDTEVKKPY